MNNTKGN